MTAMLEEIHQQPVALRETLDYLEGRKRDLAALDLTRFERVLLIGRGTSDNACNYAQYAFPVAAGRLATSFSPSIATVFEADVPLAGTLAIAISQSGKTAEIVDSLAWAKRNGAGTLAITNGVDSPLAEQADIALVTPAGRERAVPATKSYTTALLALGYVAAVMGEDTELEGLLRSVPAVVSQQLERAAEAGAALDILAGAATAIVAGRGYTYGVAQEIALKLTETSSINARGMSTADLMHGPVAALVQNLPLILLSAAKTSPFAQGLQFIGDRARQMGCKVLSIGPDATFVGSDRHLLTVDVPEPLQPFAMSIPGQLLAEAHATSLGLDPDSPQGLNKVTVTL